MSEYFKLVKDLIQEDSNLYEQLVRSLSICFKNNTTLNSLGATH